MSDGPQPAFTFHHTRRVWAVGLCELLRKRRSRRAVADRLLPERGAVLPILVMHNSLRQEYRLFIQSPRMCMEVLDRADHHIEATDSLEFAATNARFACSSVLKLMTVSKALSINGNAVDGHSARSARSRRRSSHSPRDPRVADGRRMRPGRRRLRRAPARLDRCPRSRGS